MPSRLSQTKNSQCFQVFAGLSFGDPLAKLFMYFPERQSSTGFAQTQQHPLLPLRHILCDPPRRHITCVAEPAPSRSRQPPKSPCPFGKAA